MSHWVAGTAQYRFWACWLPAGDFYRALLLNTANKCLPALPNVANDCICFIMNIGGEGDTFSVTAFDIHNRRLSLIGFKTSKDNRAPAWYGNRTGALHFDVVFRVFSVQSNFVFRYGERALVTPYPQRSTVLLP